MDLTLFQQRRVTVAVPDATRPIDPAVIERLMLGLAEVRAKATILIALGLHRPMTPGELAPLVAIAARSGALLVQHDAHDRDSLVQMGDAQFHRAIAGADAVIAVGLVEPHQYAGFSGGVKTVAIGCAGADTIAHLHGLHLLRQPGTRIGCIAGNPFQAELQRLASPLDIWALQIVPGGGTYFGRALDAFAHAVEEAAKLCFVDVPHELDWMHLVVPPAKAQTFYQASRAATYVALVDRPAIARGGLLLVDAACPEGLGSGAGERAFVRAMARGRASLMRELQSDEQAKRAASEASGGGREGFARAGPADRIVDGGEQRAYVLALALERAEIAIVGAPPMPELDALGIRQLKEVPQLSGRGGRFADPFAKLPRLGGDA